MTSDDPAQPGRKLLFVLPDLDTPPTKGYQVRCIEIAAALGARHTVRVVSGRTTRRNETVAANRRHLWRVASLLRRVLDGLPLQAAPFDGPDVARRVKWIVREWRPDAIVVMTERMPDTTAALCSEILVVDVVDAMRLNMEQRARNAGIFMHALWSREARAFTRQARRIERCAKIIIAASATAHAEYPTAHIVPNAAKADNLPRGAPTIDVIFTGNLAYWPNVRAAIELCEEIAPRIRRGMPEATIVVAGRRPVSAIRRACAAAGVTLQADVPDLGDLVRASRVAVAPLRWSGGGNLKILEAVAAGTPVLCYRAASQQLPDALEGIRECADAEEMANAALAILRSDQSPIGPGDMHIWPARARSLEDLLEPLLQRASEKP